MSTTSSSTLSHPEIRFKFMWDGRTKIQTSGNGNVKDNIYNQFGADITKALLPVTIEKYGMRVTGFIGKPELSRGTRSFMNYYINGRYIKSPIVQKAIENAYSGFTMTNRFPFTTLFLDIDSALLDVNVHPSKMEVRFTNQEEVYDLFETGLHEVLNQAVLIPKVTLANEKEQAAEAKKEKRAHESQPQADSPEPFETNRINQELVRRESDEQVQDRQAQGTQVQDKQPQAGQAPVDQKPLMQQTEHPGPKQAPSMPPGNSHPRPIQQYEQQTLYQEDLLKEDAAISFRLIGQVFGTYWLVEWNNELLIIDQHAAHEKVLYEQLIHELDTNHVYSQNLLTPIVLTLTHREKEALQTYRETFASLGFEIEDFGGDEYAIKAVPSHFLHLASKQLFYSILDELLENSMASKYGSITDRCASIACKAAVKGNHTLSFAEAETLMKQMLQAKEPYHCPHGRPTTISMSKQEFEKKFKRIV